MIADRLELEEKLFEPELEDLVDRDEQELVVSRRVGLQLLQFEELGDLQVAAVGKPAILLTELRRLSLERQSSFFPLPPPLPAPASDSLLVGAESPEFSATGVGSGADAYIGFSSPAMTDTIGVPTSTMS